MHLGHNPRLELLLSLLGSNPFLMRFCSNREQSSRLDRKSSRGMIYENEELRLRTININAEVERGELEQWPPI